MAKKPPLYPHVPKGKQPQKTEQSSENNRELASQLAQTVRDLQSQAETVQLDVLSHFAEAKNLNKRITDAVDALSDVGVYLRTTTVRS